MKLDSNFKKTCSLTLLLFVLSAPALTLPAQETRRLLSGPNPVYPNLARKMQLSGTVKVQITIGADGAIKEMKFVGGHPILIGAVQNALKEWKYAPAPGETTVSLEFSFHP
jgi:TonB family protein